PWAGGWRWGPFHPASATADAVLTIDPPPLRSIEAIPYFIPRNTPRRLTAWTSSKVASLCSASGMIGPPKPALLQRTSRRPNAFSAAEILPCTSAETATSAWTASAAAPIPAAVSSSLPLRSAQTTRAPSAAKSSAIALPIPEPAPVITATLSLNRTGAPPFGVMCAGSTASRQLAPREQRVGAFEGVGLTGERNAHGVEIRDPERREARELPAHLGLVADDRDVLGRRRAAARERRPVRRQRRALREPARRHEARGRRIAADRDREPHGEPREGTPRRRA